MIIFRTSAETFVPVIRHAKYALPGVPRNLNRGDLILLSLVGTREIVFAMEFVRTRVDTDGETQELFGRSWPIILDCENCLPLKNPFVIEDHAVSGQNYGPGGTSVYVHPEDERALVMRGLLTTRTIEQFLRDCA